MVTCRHGKHTARGTAGCEQKPITEKNAWDDGCCLAQPAVFFRCGYGKPQWLNIAALLQKSIRLKAAGFFYRVSQEMT
jgi:hypothetical protein